MAGVLEYPPRHSQFVVVAKKDTTYIFINRRMTTITQNTKKKNE